MFESRELLCVLCFGFGIDLRWLIFYLIYSDIQVSMYSMGPDNHDYYGYDSKIN